MSQNTMAAVAIAFVLGVLTVALWYQNKHPRQIVATSTVVVDSRKPGGARQTLNVRTVRIDQATFQEVEMPNGTWIGCEGDCRRAAREAGEEFWDAMARSRH
jgi:hypothetical protein